MRHKLFNAFFISMAALSALFTACGDDDTTSSSDKNEFDPRIRSMRINGIEPVFVINDVDQIIYNYDSLDAGTDLTAVSTRFYGYTSQPTIQVRKDGVWEEFKNGSLLNLNNPVEILSTSYDKSHQKQYTIIVRIHNYDVAAITWNKYGTIDNKEKIACQQSFSTNQNNYWFYKTTSGESYLMSSKDLKKWSKKSLNIEDADWTSSAILGDSIYVQDGSKKIYAASLSTLKFASYSSEVELEKILFTIGKNIWAIAKEENGYALYAKGSADFQKKATLPTEFPTENLITFTSTSGYTSLGYIFATQNGNGTVWSIDNKGNARMLQQPDGTIPALTNPILFQYENMLGIVGGEKEDGTHSTQCYSSKNCGVSWSNDRHKELTGDVAKLSQAGTFVLSQEGEILFVGGNTSKGASTTIWKGVLNKLTADDLNYQN